MNKQSLLILLALAVAASGCVQPFNTPTPESTAQATATASKTPLPATRTPIPPTPTITPVPRLVLPQANFDTSVSLSPAGKWINVKADTYFWFPDQQVEQVRFQRRVINVADPTIQWPLVEEWSRAGLGMSYPEIIAWSPDEQFVYLSYVGHADGCGLPFAAGLRRVNLTDGKARVIDREARWPFALSPDGQTMAAGSLQLLNFDDGTERTVELALASDEAVLITYWSPDSRNLLVLVADTQGDMCGYYEWPYSLVSVNAETLAVKILIERDARRFTIAEWPQPNQVLLQDKDGGQWWLEVSTGTLTPAP